MIMLSFVLIIARFLAGDPYGTGKICVAPTQRGQHTHYTKDARKNNCADRIHNWRLAPGQSALMLRRLAVWKEGWGRHFRQLGARGASAGAEVGAVLPVAGLARPAAGGAAGDVSPRQLVDP